MKRSRIFGITAMIPILIIAAFVADNPLFGVIHAAFLIYVAVTELDRKRQTDADLKFLSEVDVFLGNLKHHYFRTGSIRDAFFYASGNIKEPLRHELAEMLEIIESPDMRTLGNAFQNSGKNRFLRLLMSMIMLVDENGDEGGENGSVFTNAIMQFRIQVRDERRFINSRRHKFMGLTLTAALPSLSVGFIARWAVDTNPNLLLFYYGRTGTVFRMAILVSSFICFRMVSGLKNAGADISSTTENGSGPDLLGWIRMFEKGIRRTTLFCLAGIIMLASLIRAHTEAIKLLRTDTGNIEMLCDIADGRQIAAMEYLIPVYTQKLSVKGVPEPDIEKLTLEMLDENGIGSPEVARSAAEEVIRRVSEIKNEGVDIWDVIIVLIAALAAAYYPELGVLFEKTVRDGKIKDEIMQLQMIVSIQKDVCGITSKTILETLECFSVYFKEPLRLCVDEYGICEREAIETLKNASDNTDFIRIADCFAMADELGVEAAFDEISAEIRAFGEDRKTERTINLENDVLMGTLAAIIPGGIILFGYLLAPFMISALNLFNSYQNSLKDFISIT